MTKFSNVAVICFDVDSTVCSDEGIDQLAEFVGKGEIIKSVTLKTMAGQIDFTQAFTERLRELNLSKTIINNYLATRPASITPGIKVRTICFDVDSTICTADGLDELGRYSGKAELIASVTTMAMNGTMDLPTAIKKRLDILQITKTNMETFKRQNPVNFTPGILRLLNALRASQVEVYLVSGGIYDLVERAAKILEIPEDHVFANRLIYSEDGRCIDFDHDQPTSRSDGKRDVVAKLKASLPPDAQILMVGDGMTDAAALPPADAFIGFGGVCVRPSVQKATPYYFYSFDAMYTFFQEKHIICCME